MRRNDVVVGAYRGADEEPRIRITFTHDEWQAVRVLAAKFFCPIDGSIVPVFQARELKDALESGVAWLDSAAADEERTEKFAILRQFATREKMTRLIALCAQGRGLAMRTRPE